MAELLRPTGNTVSEKKLKNEGVDLVQYIESENCYVRLYIEFGRLEKIGWLCSVQYSCSKEKECVFPNLTGTYGHLFDLQEFNQIEDLCWGDSWMKMGMSEEEVKENSNRVVAYCRKYLFRHAIEELMEAEQVTSRNPDKPVS